MQVYVYRSGRRADTYVYLAVRDDFSRLPPELQQRLQPWTFCFEFELTPDRSLATQDPAVVRRNLADAGFHLQMPREGLGADVG